MHIKPYQFQRPLLNWFDQHGRKNLPWQKPITAYRVWLSEIMLQQTQVKTVIPYFESFISQFPTVDDLAQAPIDSILALWSGLGYYSRARNLHRCAQIISEQYQGQFPADVELLAQLPGIGPSTAAAITSIAFKQATAILDGNVKRVLSRYFMVAGWTEKSVVKKQLWQYADALMPQARCNDYTQAIMDIGATVCKRSKPLCNQCPLHKHCLAYNNQCTEAFPHKKPTKKLAIKHKHLILISHDNKILLEKRADNGIWGGLWSLPQLDIDEDIQANIALNYQIKLESIELMNQFRHTFSHFHLEAQLWHSECEKQPLQVNDKALMWADKESMGTVGMAKPVINALNLYFSQLECGV